MSDRSRPISSAVGGATLTTTSRSYTPAGSVDQLRARLLVLGVGDQRARAGAALDDHLVPGVSSPRRTSLRTTSGTSATRRSPSAVSLGTPICIGARRLPSLRSADAHRRRARARSATPASVASGRAAAGGRCAPRAAARAASVDARGGRRRRVWLVRTGAARRAARVARRSQALATRHERERLARERHHRLARHPHRRLIVAEREYRTWPSGAISELEVARAPGATGAARSTPAAISPWTAHAVDWALEPRPRWLGKPPSRSCWRVDEADRARARARGPGPRRRPAPRARRRCRRRRWPPPAVAKLKPPSRSCWRTSQPSVGAGGGATPGRAQREHRERGQVRLVRDRPVARAMSRSSAATRSRPPKLAGQRRRPRRPRIVRSSEPGSEPLAPPALEVAEQAVDRPCVTLCGL